MEIKCAWWNTSLAPTADDKRAGDDAKKIALEVIEELLVHREIDLLGMCELSLGEIKWLAEHCEPLDLVVVNGVEQLGKSKTDTCLIYNKNKFQLSGSKNLRITRRRRTQKVAQRVELINLFDNTIITVFLSHWPSVLMINKGSPKRTTLGSLLRDEVDSIFEVAPDANIILMGDYNDEPFDLPLAYELAATRDRHRAANESEMIYNPFWNRIGNDRKYDGNPNDIGFSGTHFFPGDEIDRWRTFDQIMVSTALLDTLKWSLDESSVEIINIPSYTPFVFDRKKHFDHFPVSLTIKRATA